MSIKKHLAILAILVIVTGVFSYLGETTGIWILITLGSLFELAFWFYTPLKNRKKNNPK